VRIVHFSSRLNLLVAAATLSLAACGSDEGGPGPGSGGSSGSHDGASVGTGGSSIPMDAARPGTGGSVGTGGAAGTGGSASPDAALADTPSRDAAVDFVDAPKVLDGGVAVDGRGDGRGSMAGQKTARLPGAPRSSSSLGWFTT